MEELNDTERAVQPSPRHARFLEIAARYSSVKEVQLPSERLVWYFGDDYRRRENHIRPTSEETRQVARLLEPGGGVLTHIRKRFSKGQLWIPTQQNFVSATALLLNPRIVNSGFGLVESILELGGLWDQGFDDEIMMQQERLRIQLAASAIEQGNFRLCSVYWRFLLPQHQDFLLFEYFDNCKPHEVRFMSGKGADPTLFRPLNKDASRISACMYQILLWRTSHRCKVLLGSPVSSLEPGTVCNLCIVLLENRDHVSPLQLAKAALASNNILTLLKIFYHFRGRWRQDQMVELMPEILKCSSKSSQAKTDAIEAAICAEASSLKYRDLSAQVTRMEYGSTDSQLRSRAHQDSLDLDSFYRKCVELDDLSTIKMLQRYPFPPSRATVELCIDHREEKIFNVLICGSSLPHSTAGLVHTMQVARRRILVLHKLLNQGHRCSGFIDEIWWAIVNGRFKLAERLVLNLYDMGDSLQRSLPKESRLYEFYSPECSTEHCPKPGKVKELGWCDNALPASCNAAFTGLLHQSLQQTYSYPYSLFERHYRASTSIYHFSRNGLEFDDQIERCLQLLSRVEPKDHIIDVVKYCWDVPGKTLYPCLLSHVGRLSHGWTDAKFSEIIVLHLKQMSPTQRLENLKAWGELVGSSELPVLRLLIKIVGQQNFGFGYQQACFSSVVQACLENPIQKLMEPLIKQLALSSFRDDSLVRRVLNKCITDGLLRKNASLFRALVELLTPKSTAWLLDLPQAHDHFGEELLSVILEKCGRTEIPALVADKMLDNAVDGGRFRMDLTQELILHASPGVKQSALFRFSARLKEANLEHPNGFTGYGWRTSFHHRARVKLANLEPHRALSPQIQVFCWLADEADVHLKYFGWSPFMNIVLSGFDVPMEFMDQANSSEAQATILALVDEASVGRDASKQIGRCALMFENAIKRSVNKANFMLPEAVFKDLANTLWGVSPVVVSSAQLVSLILSLVRRSEALVQWMWREITSHRWPSLASRDSSEAFRIFVNWARLASTCMEPPPLLWAVRQSQDSIVDLLIKNGAPNDDGSLHEAAGMLEYNKTALLLDAGHDPNYRSRIHFGRTVLAEVCSIAKSVFEGDAVDVLSLLQRRGADPNLPSGLDGHCVQQPIFFALGSPSFLLNDFLEVTSSNPNAMMGEWLQVRGNICRSPTSYFLEHHRRDPIFWHARRVEARLETLQRYGFLPRFYALEGPQPAGAIGLPPEMQRMENNRIDPKTLIGRTCDVCGDEIADPSTALGFLTTECDHAWVNVTCKDDLESYLAVQMQMTDGAVSDQIRCWAPNCKVILDYQHLKRYAEAKDFETYDAALFKQAIHRGKEFFKCATPGCHGGGWIDSNHKLNRFICTLCNDVTCIDCSSLYSRHGGKDCPVGAVRRSAKHAADNVASEQFIDQNYCIGVCGHSVEKIAGCDHITCTMCKRHFCYVCRADYEVIWKRGLRHHKGNCRYWRAS